MHATEHFLLPASLSKRSRALPLDKKSIDDGVFEGYASLFNREDLGHDVIAPGAFRESLASRGAARIKMLFQHDPAEPIGVWDEIREDARGLYVRGRLMTAVSKAREVLMLMRAGALDGLSIGFKAVKARRDAATGVRRLEKVDLWEISVVTFPMLPGARVESVKARPFDRGAPTMREFERWLTRDAGLTRMEARAVLRSGFNGLKALRDAGRTFDDDAVLASRFREAARLMQAT
jgi:HK97 family phage prohead protease